MDLKKFLPGTNKNESEEFYWSLIIEPGWVQAGIWKITGKNAEVVYTSKPVVWEEESELVNASDTVLSSAIQNFPEDSNEPTKTVFGVSYAWIKEGEIAPEHLDKIKKICTELSLSPVGFVVMAEAITHLVKSETGTPLNAIILGIYKQNLELSLFDKGKLTGTTIIARSISLMEDIVEGLTRLTTGEVLPSSILIYDGREGDLEEARQDLLKIDWEDYENIKFLHSPKVEIISSERKVFAVSLAGASELAGITSLVPQTVPQVESKEEILKEINPVKDDTSISEVVSPEDVGFTIENTGEEELDEGAFARSEKDQLTSEEDLEMMESNVTQVEEKEVLEKPAQNKKLKVNNFYKKLFTNTQLLSAKIPRFKFSLPGTGNSSKPFVWGGMFLFILLILGGVFWWFVPSASVTIYLASKKIEESVDLSVDLNIAEPNTSQKQVPGEIVETQTEGEKTTDTTGTKTIGDKAKGEVTVYRVGPRISLSSGTLINGPNSLKFVVDSSVSIASGSASTPGETKVPVTAQDIGAQYNLASSATFSIANYSSSDMEAKNSTSFSGGNSREIQAVSKADQTDLEKSLSDELKEKAEDELSNKLNDDEMLIPESLLSQAVSSNFNKKVGDEANSLKLDLKLKVSGIVLKEKDLEKIAEETLKSKVPDGYVLTTSQLDYSFGDIKKDGEIYKFKLKVIANLLPNVSDDEVKDKIKGRQIPIAKEYLQSGIPAFTRVEIKIKPTLPGKLKTLPHVEKNISIQFSADR